jgi:putative phosphonate catabolism associated alcohol dehydrogenase
MVSERRSADSFAAVFHGVDQPLALERFPLPEPAGSEVLVRVLCATICGSDLHSYFGRRHSPAPAVLGHEMVGEISVIGPDGACDYEGVRLEPGDRVTWSMVWSCGRCFYCRCGLPPKCERLMKFGHEAIVPGRALTGGMAEYCHLPAGTAIFRVPRNLPDVVASPSNCATATVAAVLRHAGALDGETLVIHGAGMLGLTACAMAAGAGAMHVVVIEPDPRRRETALQFGASLTLDPALSPAGIADYVMDLTAGRGADAGLELSGYPDSMELGLGLLRPGGRFIMAGATFPCRPAQVSAEQLVRRMIRITGVYNYTPEDLKAALVFLSGAVDRYPFAGLVAASYPLREANFAIVFAEKTRPPRVALIP